MSVYGCLVNIVHAGALAAQLAQPSLSLAEKVSANVNVAQQQTTLESLLSVDYVLGESPRLTGGVFVGQFAYDGGRLIHTVAKDSMGRYVHTVTNYLGKDAILYVVYLHEGGGQAVVKLKNATEFNARKFKDIILDVILKYRSRAPA